MNLQSSQGLALTTSSTMTPSRGWPRKAYDLDLSRMEDEALVVMADECAFTPAVNALIERYHEYMNSLIGMLARARNLSEADVQDAQQEAVFALREAIASYDRHRMGMGMAKGCSFRTFLRLVLVARFRNFVKIQRRAGKRFGHSFDLPVGPRFGMEQEQIQGESQEPETNQRNPYQAAEREELLNRFHQAVGQLEESDRQLWDRLTSGRGLREVASELGLSYEQAKRKRRHLLDQLRGTLNDRVE